MARVGIDADGHRRGGSNPGIRHRLVVGALAVVAMAAALTVAPAQARPGTTMRSNLAAASADYGQPPQLASTLSYALGNLKSQDIFDLHDTFAETYEIEDHQQASEQTPRFSNGRSLQFMAQAEINAPDQTAKLLVFQSRAGEADAEGIINGSKTNPQSQPTARIPLDAALLGKTETHPGGMSWLAAPKNTQGGFVFMSNEYVNHTITAFYFDQNGTSYAKVDGSLPVCEGAVVSHCLDMDKVNDVSVFLKDGTYYLFAFDLNLPNNGKHHWEAWSAPADQFLDIGAFPPAAGAASGPAAAMHLSALNYLAGGTFTGAGQKPSDVTCKAQQHTVLEDSTGAWYIMSLGGSGTCGSGAGIAHVWTNRVTFPADGCSQPVCVVSDATANETQVGGNTRDYYYPTSEGAANLGVTSGKRLFVTKGALYAYYDGTSDYFTRQLMYVQDPATAAGAPTNLAASSSGAKAFLTWSAPSSLGGSSIQGYRVTPYRDGAPQTPQEFPYNTNGVTVLDLWPGSSYTFTVAAKTGLGYGTESAKSNAVIPSNPIPNDAFASPIVLSGSSATRSDDSNKWATKEAGEPYHAGDLGGASVWYRWTASSARPVTIDTAGSDFDTVLAVYTGGSVGSLAPVVSNNDADGGFTSKVTFTPTPGTTYQIAVDGRFFYSGPWRGTIDLHLAVAPASAPGAPTGVTASAGDAQAIVGWLAPSSDGYSPVTGYIVTPYKGGVAQPELVFNTPELSQVLTGLENGASYTFTVAAKNAIGTGPASDPSSAVVPTAAPPSPPFNDDFVNAPALPVDSYTYVASNVAATRETGEPLPLGYASGKSTWAKFTRPTNGKLTLDTCGTTFDTLMAVYTGSAVDDLTPVAENDEGDCGYGPSKLSIDVVAGTTYYIDVTSYDPDGAGPLEPAEGFIKFTWRFQTAPAAVTSVSAAGGIAQATVSWAPGPDGDSPITGYVVTPYIGATAQTPVTFDDTDTEHAVPVAGGATYTFTVAAKNAIGTGPEGPASGAVAIAAPFTPFASWADLVKRQYQDLTATAPSTAALQAWVAQLTAGTKTIGDLDDALRRSAENTTNVDPAARLYRAFLQRTPDASGLKFWVKRRRTGAWTLNRTAQYFSTSSEFTRKYGNLTNRQFVTRIYTDVLGRTADPTGVDYWTRQLDLKRRNRGSVMVGFSESSEYRRKQAENTDVAIAYIMLLGRAPTGDEVDGWISVEKADPTLHDDLLLALLHSDAYLTHIGG